MKAILIIVLFISSFSAYSKELPDGCRTRYDSVADIKSIELAKEWVKLLSKGDKPDSLMSISGLPFYWDRKKVLNHLSSLDSAYKQVLEKKGKRSVIIYEAVIVTDMKDNLPEAYKNATVVRIQLGKPGDMKMHGIVILVWENKVVGFKD